jgi:hypothetical protein
MFEKDSALHTQLQSTLNAKNPYYTDMEDKSGDRKEDEFSEEGTSVIEEDA